MSSGTATASASTSPSTAVRAYVGQPVTPGDQLILEAEAVRAKPRTATVKCRAFVGPRVAAEALIKFMMVDAEQD